MDLAQPYVDLQVNGYAGVDFNSNDTAAEQISSACERLRVDGVGGILATVITDDVERMYRRLQNIVRARESDRGTADMIWGIHIEGPFLNARPGFIGAHPAEHAKVANVDDMRRLLDAAEGITRIVTLAPERDPGCLVTSLLAKRGITVSAGHCDVQLDQLHASIDHGLTMFTHLGNGCPMLLPRHDNIIQRVLACSDRLWIGLIGDGVHVPYFVLRNWLRGIGTERAFIVTDAISAAGLGPGEFRLADRSYVVDNDLATWAADRSHLVGSASTMPIMAEKLRTKAGLTDEIIRQLTSVNPRRVIGISA